MSIIEDAIVWVSEPEPDNGEPEPEDIAEAKRIIIGLLDRHDELRETVNNQFDELRMFYQADGSGTPLDSPEECKRLRILAAQENKRLRDAISWALGEGNSDFGDNKPENAPTFWWRRELRQRAGMV